MSGRAFESVLVTGGAGYVGAVLVPRLLDAGYRVRVLDVYAFGRDALASVAKHPRLEEVEADLRDDAAVRRSVADMGAVIHLACISNDPSCELAPALSREINYDSFEPLLRMSEEAGVRRFVFASSSSVYGVSNAPEVREDHPLEPITDYNRYKGMCETVLFRHQAPDFTTVAIRPGTVCGRSPRQRLDLTVNILTAHAVERGTITVFGGAQRRPNIHMQDMVDLYLLMLEAPAERIGGQAFNAGYECLTIRETAEAVRDVVASEMPDRPPIAIETAASNDPRSYHVTSEKLTRTLGFVPKRGVRAGSRDVAAALAAGALPGALSDERYYNVKMLKALGMR